MKYVVALLSIFSFICFSSPSFAQSTGQATTLKKGQPAPFDGTLLDPVAVATIIADKETAKKQCELDSSLSLSKQQAKCSLDSANLKLERDILAKKYETVVGLKDKELNRLYDTLAKNEKSNSWKYVWFAVGIVAGAGTTIGIAYALNGAR